MIENETHLMYFVYSDVNDWEAGSWPEIVPQVTQFDLRDEAFATFQQHQKALNTKAQGEVKKLHRGVEQGRLTATGGFTVMNIVFAVPVVLLTRIRESGDSYDRENALEEFREVLPNCVLDSGCYDFNYERYDSNYERARSKADIGDFLCDFPVEDLLDVSQ